MFLIKISRAKSVRCVTHHDVVREHRVVTHYTTNVPIIVRHIDKPTPLCNTMYSDYHTSYLWSHSLRRSCLIYLVKSLDSLRRILTQLSRKECNCSPYYLSWSHRLIQGHSCTYFTIPPLHHCPPTAPGQTLMKLHLPSVRLTLPSAMLHHWQSCHFAFPPYLSGGSAPLGVWVFPYSKGCKPHHVGTM